MGDEVACGVAQLRGRTPLWPFQPSNQPTNQSNQPLGVDCRWEVAGSDRHGGGGNGRPTKPHRIVRCCVEGAATGGRAVRSGGGVRGQLRGTGLEQAGAR